jgi:hypothetical protein
MFQTILRFIKNRKYHRCHLGQHILIIDPNFDIGIQEYYKYVTSLFMRAIERLPPYPKKITFILGITNYQIERKIPYKQIGFQVEHTLVKPGGRGSENAPLGNTLITSTLDQFYCVRIQNLSHLLEQDIIIEYSRPNIKHIKDSGLYQDYLNKVCQISPTLYHLDKEKVSNQARSLNTVTLFRDINEPRRKKFLEGLRRHQVPFENINHVFQNLDQVYLNTKILVNIRQTDHHDTLEELRILPALQCGVIVISEDAPLKKYSRYSDFIIWGTIQELPNLIKNVLANYETYHQTIFSSAFYNRINRLELSNSKALDKLLALHT